MSASSQEEAALLTNSYMVRNIPLASLGQLSGQCPLPASCAPLAPCWQDNKRNWNILGFMQHSSATAKTPVCYQPYSHPKYIKYQPLWRKLALFQLKLVQNLSSWWLFCFCFLYCQNSRQHCHYTLQMQKEVNDGVILGSMSGDTRRGSYERFLVRM